MLSRCTRMSPDLAQIAAHDSADLDEGPGQRVSGGAGLVVSFDFHDALAAYIANEFLYAPACLSFGIVPEMTGPGNQPSYLSVVAAAGMVGTTTSRRARQWARDTVRPWVGAWSEAGPAIPHSLVRRPGR